MYFVNEVYLRSTPSMEYYDEVEQKKYVEIKTRRKPVLYTIKYDNTAYNLIKTL